MMRHRAMTRIVASRVVRVAAAVTVTGALVGAGGVTPFQLSPAEEERQLRASVLAEIMKAAAPTPDPRPASTPSSGPAPSAAPKKAPSARLASGHWKHGRGFRIDAGGTRAEFSGYRVSGDLDVTLDRLPTPSATAGLPGKVVGAPFELRATAADGSSRTQFPAQKTHEVAATSSTPARADVRPGVRLTVDVTAAQAKAAGADARTLKLYTRESDDEQWTLLPSFYDAKTGEVVAESTHLSQFVVIGTPWAPPARPRVVLDPDQNIGWTTSPADVTEGPYNVALAQGVAAELAQFCQADVALTGTDPNGMVSADVRAGIAAAFDPVATMTMAFNTSLGHAWGADPSEGGSMLYTRGIAQDKPLSNAFQNTLPAYTGRPSTQLPFTGEWPPAAEFGSVPGAYTHAEVLYLDNNYDWAVINNGFSHVVDGVFTSIGKYLQTKGFTCTDPATGGWPSPPSAAELARYRQLGHQNYQTYGAEPISFSTGNLVEDEPTFTLTGPGGQSLDGTLTYNAQDGRLSRVGAGWSFGLGARVQRFDDGSVLVVRGDGASFDFAADGNGGYCPDQGVNETLAEAGSGKLQLTDPSGESWLFDASGVEGVGNLVSHTDRAGHTTTFTYGAAGAGAQFLPLTAVTDSSGQSIRVTDDSLGRITVFSLPDGRAWKLAYDGAGNLVTITDPAGGAKRFTYDGEHRMLTATDPTGVEYLTNTYDSAGRVVKQVDADGRVRSLSYGAGQTVYTDQNGATASYAFDGRSRITSITQPGQASQKYTYNADDSVATYTDASGRTWKYTYDTSGNVLR